MYGTVPAKRGAGAVRGRSLGHLATFGQRRFGLRFDDHLGGSRMGFSDMSFEFLRRE